MSGTVSSYTEKHQGFLDTILDFERDIVKRMQKGSSLLVLPIGFSYRKILISLTLPYLMEDEFTDLFFILNASKQEIERMKIEYMLAGAKLPVVAISELNQNKRSKMYREGGIFFISSQVLTLDLMKNLIEREIHSIFILTPEKVLRKKEENFILHLAHAKKLQFHHCLSNSPIQISKNFSDIMSSLMVSKSHMFPRFHELVKLDVKSTEDWVYKTDSFNIFDKISRKASKTTCMYIYSQRAVQITKYSSLTR